MTLESTGNSNEPSPVSRRTMLRGTAATAATVWTASAITMVTATPAHAASADLKLAFETARYRNNTLLLLLGVDPSRLDVEGTYGNEGPQTAQSFQVTLSIPANLYATAPTATTPTGFGAPSISGSLEGGWTLVFTRSTPLASGTVNQAFNTTITFTDPATSFANAPFRRWAGSQFTLSVTATATNGTPASAAPTIAAIPNVNIEVTEPNARWRNASTTISGRHVQYRASKVYNNGRSSIGKMKLELRLTKSTSSGSYLNDPPNTAAEIREGSRWQQLAGAAGYNFTGTQYRFFFESIDNGFTPSTGVNGGSDATDGPVDPEGIDILILTNGGSNIFSTGFTDPHATMIVSADHANPNIYTENGLGS